MYASSLPHQGSAEPIRRPDYKAKPHSKPKKWVKRRPSAIEIMHQRPTTCAWVVCVVMIVPAWLLTGDVGVVMGVVL